MADGEPARETTRHKAAGGRGGSPFILLTLSPK